MKKIISLLLVTIIMLCIGITAYASDDIHVTLDGSYVEFDVKPQMINGRTMVPIRAIFEKMGASVVWDSATRTAVCTKGDTTVKMTVDSVDMYINGQLNKMDVSPVVIDGRTLAPARYVAEAFGAEVKWDGASRTVVITTGTQSGESVVQPPNQTAASTGSGEIVYIGETGTKYHYQTCRTLKNGAYPITMEEALAQGRQGCKVCGR